MKQEINPTEQVESEPKMVVFCVYCHPSNNPYSSEERKKLQLVVGPEVFIQDGMCNSCLEKESAQQLFPLYGEKISREGVIVSLDKEE